MSALILGEHDVQRLLPMDECIAVMEEVLAALARDELYNPLRSVVRPPDTTTLMGLMPAYRGGENPAYGLKTVCIAPGNSALGLDPHQGFVTLFDGETGQLQTVMHAGAITAIRTAAVSGVATKLLARPESKTLAILGAGVQGALAPRGDARGDPVRGGPGLEPDAGARLGARRGRPRRPPPRRPCVAPMSS